ncbi:hypothetical protein Pcinc_044140 [Petrolisthes cinctipes]|uniref:Uncharacterized protein n=1 Tax=Petrolisthes cinctipes TaxID=88211 RepID=A0AAE1EFN2_PETCI|nr:hypothetical protein Pcinc_044140 [Petrolisthes cinctipes]
MLASEHGKRQVKRADMQGEAQKGIQAGYEGKLQINFARSTFRPQHSSKLTFPISLHTIDLTLPSSPTNLPSHSPPN